MSGLFLSHSSQDKQIVYRLAFDLAARGFPVWFDAWEVQIGHQLTEAINAGIDDSDYVLVVISQNTQLSQYWVPAEIEQALELEHASQRTIVIPILLDKSAPPEQLRDRVYADFSESYHTGLERLSTELRNLGVHEVAVPISRRVIPLLIREGTKLQKSVFSQAVEATRDSCLPGDKLHPHQLRLSPDDKYRIERDGMLHRMDVRLSPEQEDGAQALNSRLVRDEATLLEGISLIVNEAGLSECNIDATTAAYWFCKLMRTTMLWLAVMTNKWLDGHGDQPNPSIDAIYFTERFEEAYECTKFDKVDVGPRHPSDIGMYDGFRLRIDPALGLEATVQSWYEDTGALGLQDPLKDYISWLDISKWVVPQLLYHVLYRKKNLPITWSYDYWMLGLS